MSALEDTQPMNLIDIADAMSGRSPGRPDAMEVDHSLEPNSGPLLAGLR